MIGSITIVIAIGAVFLGGALSGWRLRSSGGPKPGTAAHDTVLALQLRNEMLRESARAAHERAAALEIDLAAALISTTHLELEAERLSQALDEANAEVLSANAWVRKVWRERAIAQGAPRRHPSAISEERASPPEPAPRPIATVQGDGDAWRRSDTGVRWN